MQVDIKLNLPLQFTASTVKKPDVRSLSAKACGSGARVHVVEEAVSCPLHRVKVTSELLNHA